jgi:hypothetical protein
MPTWVSPGRQNPLLVSEHFTVGRCAGELLWVTRCARLLALHVLHASPLMASTILMGLPVGPHEHLLILAELLLPLLLPYPLQSTSRQPLAQSAHIHLIAHAATLAPVKAQSDGTTLSFDGLPAKRNRYQQSRAALAAT